MSYFGKQFGGWNFIFQYPHCQLWKLFFFSFDLKHLGLKVKDSSVYLYPDHNETCNKMWLRISLYFRFTSLLVVPYWNSDQLSRQISMFEYIILLTERYPAANSVTPWRNITEQFFISVPVSGRAWACPYSAAFGQIPNRLKRKTGSCFCIAKQFTYGSLKNALHVSGHMLPWKSSRAGRR